MQVTPRRLPEMQGPSLLGGAGLPVPFGVAVDFSGGELALVQDITRPVAHAIRAAGVWREWWGRRANL